MNQEWSEECFREALITEELSTSSVLKYRDSIKKFFSLVNKRFDELENRDFDEFVLRMKENGASSSRIHNVIYAVAWVIKKLERKGIKSKVILEKINKPKIRKKEVNYLSEDEIKRFFEVVKKDGDREGLIRNTRFMALFMFLIQTGGRIGEILKIKIKDIDRQNMEVPIVGKGKKARTLFLMGETLFWLDKYLKIRKTDSEYVFVTLSGSSQWQQTDVGRSFRRYRKLSGIHKHFTLHTFRHTFASQLVAKHVPMNKIQYLLGHSNLETTIRYYIGSIEKSEAKEFMQDKYFDFIPKAAINGENWENEAVGND